jgi:hypothetical protein
MAKSSEADRLRFKILVAKVCAWISGLLSIAPFLPLLRLFRETSGPEGGFAGMALMFQILPACLIALFPWLFVVFALDWKKKSQMRLAELEPGTTTPEPRVP